MPVSRLRGKAVPESTQRSQDSIARTVADNTRAIDKTRRVEIIKPAADGAPGTATSETPFFVADRDVRVVSVQYVDSGQIVADASDYATLFVRKRDGGGGSAVTVAERRTDAGTNGKTLQAFQPALFVMATNNADVPTGSVLTFEITKTGTGVTLGRGVWWLVLEVA